MCQQIQQIAKKTDVVHVSDVSCQLSASVRNCKVQGERWKVKGRNIARRCRVFGTVMQQYSNSKYYTHFYTTIYFRGISSQVNHKIIQYRGRILNSHT